MKLCDRCGADNSEGSRFCRKCGNKLGDGDVLLQPSGEKRKPKRRLALGLACVALAVVAGVAIAASGVLSPERPVDQEGPFEQESLDAELTRLANLNGGDVPEIYFDDGDQAPRFISGCFTERPIANGDEAIASLADVSALYNMKDPSDEFEEASVDSYAGATHYRLQQMYKGVEVYGKQLVVSADEEGRATALSGDYDPGLEVSVEPSVPLDDAMATVRAEASGDAVLDGKLVVYALSQSDPLLAWKIDTAEERFFVSAETGDVAGAQSLVYTETAVGTGIDNAGVERSFNTRRSSVTSYILADDQRNFLVYDSEGKKVEQAFFLVDSDQRIRIDWTASKEWRLRDNGAIIDMEPNDDGSFTVRERDTGKLLMESARYVVRLYNEEHPRGLLPVANDATVWSSDEKSPRAKAVAAIANVAQAYDYYQSKFHRKGADGSNGQMQISVGDVFGDKGEDRTNAASLSGGLTFCVDNNISLETAIHEYTHSVERTISEMVYSGETGALMEAYSDIMGCLGNRDSAWQFDEALFNRNLADPAKTKNPAALRDRYWKTPFDDPKDDNDDYGYVHTNCTVIGHAAYLMNKNGISMGNLEQIWYHSLYYLSPTADFKTCRAAVIAAAANLDYGEASLSIIRAAFSEVGVSGSGRFVLAAPDADVQVLDSAGNLVQDASMTVFSLSDDATVAELDLEAGECNLGSIRLEQGRGYRVQIDDARDVDSPPVSVRVFVREKGVKKLVIETDFGEQDSALANRASIPDDAAAYNGHRYKIYAGVCDSWEAAEEYCERLGGHLAVIEGEDENRFLYDLMRSENYDIAYFGITDSAEEGLWEWVQKRPSPYTNWSKGEPNNEGGNEDYGMFYYKSPPYTWNDGNFCDGTVNDKPNFICEWEDAGSKS